VEITTQERHLVAVVNGRAMILQRDDDDSFITGDAEFSRHSLRFQRSAATNKKPGPVVELIHGSNWYTNARYEGPRSFVTPDAYKALAGTYVTNGIFGDMIDIAIVKGDLWAAGAYPLQQIGDRLFRPANEPNSPETIEFLHIVHGKARLLKFSGGDLWRFEDKWT
jgi:hypothetical protein